MKFNPFLVAIVFVFVGLIAVCGYIVGEGSDSEAWSTGYQDGIYESKLHYEPQIANLDSCLVMCHEQGMLTYNKWQQCVNQPRLLKPWISASHEGNGLTLRHWADDYDSVVVSNDILYERAIGSKTAWNNGVLYSGETDKDR